MKYQPQRRENGDTTNPVMRVCISCKQTYDRKHLLKITKDHKQGVMFQGMGRSAYT